MKRKQVLIALVTVPTVIIVLGAGYVVTQSQDTLQDYVSSKAFREPASQSFGVVSGFVLDREGNPVAGARVTADKVPAVKQVELGADTGEQGKFVFSSLETGTYKLYANKQEAGYLLTYSSFHIAGLAVNPAPRVEVYANQTTSDVLVQMGPKGTKLFGVVVEHGTNKTIKNAEITLQRADSSDFSYSTGLSKLGSGTDVVGEPGEFEILVPPVAFTIEVSAPGYKKWYYRRDNLDKNKSNSGKHGDALCMTSTNTKELTIALTPEK